MGASLSSLEVVYRNPTSREGPSRTWFGSIDGGDLFAAQEQPGAMTNGDDENRPFAHRIQDAVLAEEQLSHVGLGNFVFRGETASLRGGVQ